MVRRVDRVVPDTRVGGDPRRRQLIAASAVVVALATAGVQPVAPPAQAATLPPRVGAAAPLPAPPTADRGAPIASATRVVTYRGVRVTVPASWPVRDLERFPTTCARLDVHAVYLGAPGPEQSCPARVLGRTETVWLAPAGSPGLPTSDGVATGSGGEPAAAPGLSASAVGQLAVSAGRGVTVAATWQADERTARTVLASVTAAGPVPGASAPRGPRSSSTTVVYPVGAAATRATGYAFDTCAAPSVSTMAAWRVSPFSTVGIYIGGRNRGCAQPNLTVSWMGQVVGVQGWRALPIFVGLQAPCIGRRGLALISAPVAYTQGANEAREAVTAARRVGMQPGSTLYNDMEGYPRGGACTAAVLTYLSAWTDTLHGYGYLSGVYSSASGAIADLAADPPGGRYTEPDVIWSARWDGTARLFGERYVPDTRWANSQRVKQFRGDHVERWGGRSVDIDSNVVDSMVSTIGYRAVIGRQWVLVRAWANNGGRGVATLAPGRAVHVVCGVEGGSYWLGREPRTRWLRLGEGGYFPATGAGPVASLPVCAQPAATLADLNMRTGPNASSPARGVLRLGALAPVSCQAIGSLAHGSRVWDRLTNGLWVADAWVATAGRKPGFTPSLPRC